MFVELVHASPHAQRAHLTLHHAAPAPQHRVEALARRQPEVEAGVWLGVWPHLARHRGPAPPAHVSHHVEALAGEGSALGAEAGHADVGQLGLLVAPPHAAVLLRGRRLHPRAGEVVQGRGPIDSV